MSITRPHAPMVRGLAILAALLVAATCPATAQEAIDLIQNRWTPTEYLAVQGGQPAAGPTSPTSAAAKWAVEPGPQPNVIRLRNIASGLYLHAEGGQLQAGQVAAGSPGADWTLERVPPIPDVRIRNNATGGYLHTHDGPLVLGDASPQWGQSFWKFIPVGGGTRVADTLLPGDNVAPPPPPPVSGCAASNGKWLWIKGQYFCAKGCTPGFHVVGNVCVKNCAAGFHPVGNACVKNCPAGFHPAGNLCVKTCGPGFHPVGKICVKNAPLCGAGQHLSKGHCCPTGKNWNTGLKKCA